MNLWSKYERQQRRDRAADDAATERDRRYVSPFSNVAAAAAERNENRARRYTTILLAVRTVHPEMRSEAVRAEAQRLLLLEDPQCPASVFGRR